MKKFFSLLLLPIFSAVMMSSCTTQYCAPPHSSWVPPMPMSMNNYSSGIYSLQNNYAVPQMQGLCDSGAYGQQGGLYYSGSETRVRRYYYREHHYRSGGRSYSSPPTCSPQKSCAPNRFGHR